MGKEAKRKYHNRVVRRAVRLRMLNYVQMYVAMDDDLRKWLPAGVRDSGDVYQMIAGVRYTLGFRTLGRAEEFNAALSAEWKRAWHAARAAPPIAPPKH